MRLEKRSQALQACNLTRNIQADGAPMLQCALNCANDGEVYAFHPSGANVVFADSSVHFLRSGIDIRILAGLITWAGGEVVSNSDF